MVSLAGAGRGAAAAGRPGAAGGGMEAALPPRPESSRGRPGAAEPGAAGRAVGSPSGRCAAGAGLRLGSAKRSGRGDGQSGTAETREIVRKDEENGQAGVSRVTG